eukprot:scaffold53151_cov17-Tisochrysis_lutea.AAC.1
MADLKQAGCSWRSQQMYASIGNCRAIGKNQRTCGMVSDAEVCVEDDAMAPFSNCVYSCGTQLNENEDAILLANFMQHPREVVPKQPFKI